MLNELLFHNASDDPLVLAARSFIKVLKIKITPGEIEDALLKNPTFPSLAALTDLLHLYKVDSLALQTTLQHLPAMEFPALAHVRDEGGKFIVVKGIEKDQVIFLSPKNKWQKEPAEQFNKRWTGTVLMAEVNDESGDPDYEVKKRKETLLHIRKPALLLVIALLTITGSLFSHSLILSLTFVLLVTGCGITVMLGTSAFDNNTLLNKFCKTNVTTDCHAVLKSPAARLFGMIPMTSIGFIFFAGSYLSLMIGLVSGSVPVHQIALLSIIALPYTVFSIFYQYRIVRKWCPLCLTVQGIVVMMAVLLLINYSPFVLHDPGNRFMIILFIGFAVPTLYMFFPGEPFQPTSKELIGVQRKLASWSRSPELFQFIQQKERYIEVISFPHEIVLGNPAARTDILLVMDPNCKPCEQALNEMLMVYHMLQGNVKLIIRFSFDEQDKRSVYVINQLLIRNMKGIDVVKALRDLTTMRIDQWMTVYAMQPVQELAELRQHHIEWCQDSNIEATPAIFVNGYQLPKKYTIPDLPYILRETADVVQPV